MPKILPPKAIEIKNLIKEYTISWETLANGMGLKKITLYNKLNNDTPNKLSPAEYASLKRELLLLSEKILKVFYEDTGIEEELVLMNSKISQAKIPVNVENL